MTIAAIIVAAGRGTRAGGDSPKQWQMIAGRPVIAHTIAALRRHVDHICVVIHPDDHSHLDRFDLQVDSIVTGGETRDASVRAGLYALSDINPRQVLIHDAARPCVNDQVITAVIKALAHHRAAAPAIAASDTLWRGKNGHVDGVVSREGLYRAQTPQGFDYATICAAHDTLQGPATDDVAVARAAGVTVAIVDGDEANLKITTPQDFNRAAKQLEMPMDVRCGNGYDVHRFGAGDHLWLCGVKIPHHRSLQGHSDADVGMHAVTDAIYGALGRGDIGQHFPPSDPQWKGAASEIFLRHAVALATTHGYRISNVDCTLVCEFPKIGPHQPDMKAALSQIMGVDPNRISVKATTSERLGFTGREEGIAAIATATLVSS